MALLIDTSGTKPHNENEDSTRDISDNLAASDLFGCKYDIKVVTNNACAVIARD